MTVNLYGVDPSITEQRWAELWGAAVSGAPMKHCVASGFAVSVATGNRLISLTAGQATAPGVLIVSDATATVALDANGTTKLRRDVVAIEVDWEYNTAALVAIKGTPATGDTAPAPALTQTAGVKWHIPLAEVEVAPGAGQLNMSSDVDVVAPVADTGWVACTPAGAWDMGSTPALAVRRRGGVVELAGKIKRTGAAITVGSTHSFSGLALIPRGFRPSRQVSALGTSDKGAENPKVHQLVIAGNGVANADLYPITGTLGTGDVVGFQATWISEDY